jgi:ribonuclease T1
MPAPSIEPSASASLPRADRRSSLRRQALKAAWALGLALALPLSAARESALPTIALDALPKQGQKTYRLIHEGGPFPYDKDGTVFGNRERILPLRPRGYYREYTVPTPGARNRGARRIVCGGEPPQRPQACYYTDDHYNSFKQIVAAPPR